MSKFGTVVLIRHRLPMHPKQFIAVQVGRSVINFLVKKCPPKQYIIGDHIKNNKLVKDIDK